MTIGRRSIGLGHRPYVIAEVGVNHEGSLDRALQMIDEVAAGRGDAVKFQAYKADTLASRVSPAYWDRTKEPAASQYELFRRFDAFGPEEYRTLAAHCGRRGVDFLATPFDDAAVDMLECLVPAYKIASADITNFPLLRRVASKGKPVILSVGASTRPEIAAAIGELAGCEVALLHCVLNYPCPPKHANLGRIARLCAMFPGHVIGYSDHVPPDAGMTPLVTAVTAGARVIEKHFTFDKSLPGNDHYHAMDARDLAQFAAQIDLIEDLFAAQAADYLPSEEVARLQARRSLVAARDIAAGEVVTAVMLIPKRPGHGISPDQVDRVVGLTAAHEIPADTVLTWEMLDQGGRNAGPSRGRGT